MVANKRFVKIPPPPPPVMCPREVFAKIARDFEMFVLYFEPKWFTGGFFLPNTNNIVNFWIGTILQ